MCVLPRAKHDDVVDALSYQGILIDRMTEGLTQDEIKEEEYNEEREGLVGLTSDVIQQQDTK